MDPSLETPGRARLASGHRRRVLARWLGASLMVAGLLMLAWSLVVWQWNDPLTGLYTRWEQRHLARDYEALVRAEHSRYAASAAPASKGESAAETARRIAREARSLRRRVTEGSAVGRIAIPRLGLRMVMVDGTTSGALRKGPGVHRQTFMPGEGQLVYIAGHRTTYRAPFAHIDRLRPGDRVSIAMPYAAIEYAVTGHVIVDDEDLSVLRSPGREILALQACHPRFLATKRYIVWATPVRAVTHDGATIALPET
jgi:sortase A